MPMKRASDVPEASLEPRAVVLDGGNLQVRVREPGMGNEAGDARAGGLEPAGQLDAELVVGQLRVAVRPPGAVVVGRPACGSSVRVWPCSRAMLVMVTTRAAAAASRAGISSSVSTKWPRWLVPTWVSKPSFVSPAGVAMRPALLSRMSTCSCSPCHALGEGPYRVERAQVELAQLQSSRRDLRLDAVDRVLRPSPCCARPSRPWRPCAPARGWPRSRARCWHR